MPSSGIFKLVFNEHINFTAVLYSVVSGLPQGAGKGNRTGSPLLLRRSLRRLSSELMIC